MIKMRGIVLTFIVSLLWLGWLAISATPTLAHAYLTESFPRNGEVLEASPVEITAVFTQELVSGESVMKVFNADGDPVDNGDGGVDLFDPERQRMIVTVPDALPAGTYTVEWLVLSAEDDDPTNGAFAFGIQTSPAPAQSPEALEQPLVGWWMGGSISLVILGLLVTMWWLTRQPMRRWDAGQINQ